MANVLLSNCESARLKTFLFTSSLYFAWLTLFFSASVYCALWICVLSCGRPNRLQYWSFPSIRPPVCLSVYLMRASYLKKGVENQKLVQTFPVHA